MNNLSDFEFKKIEFGKVVENKVVIVTFRPSIKENLKKMGSDSSTKGNFES